MARKGKKTNKVEQTVISKKNLIFRTAIYVRLSKENSGKEDSDSIENQINIIKQFIDKKKNFNLEKIYIDNGYTGTNFNRPEFKNMMEDVKSNAVNCIVVKDLSRFGRDYITVGEYLYSEFPKLNIRFISVNDNYDSFINDTVEELVISLKNLINYAYSKDISSKSTSSLRLKQYNGDFIGSNPPYGYEKSKKNKNKLIIDKESSKIVKEIFELRAMGVKFLEIEKFLNDKGILSPKKYCIYKGYIKECENANKLKWRRQKIKVITKNIVYIGDMAQKKRVTKSNNKRINLKEGEWIIVENTHTPIISKDLWDKVQKVNKIEEEKYKKDYLENTTIHKENIFSGLIECGECGKKFRRMNRKLRNGITYKYRYKCGGRDSINHSKCKSKGEINEEVIYDTILSDLNYKLSLIHKQDFNLNNKVSVYEMDYHNILGEIEKIKVYKRNLYEKHSNSLINLDEYKKAYDKYNLTLEQLIIESNKKKEKLDIQKKNVEEKNKLLIKLGDYKYIETLRKDILKKFINKILIYNGHKIEIVWKFKDIFE